jgi:undecaprenyl pyrophosphate synthase
VFAPVHWPEFTKEQFQLALDEFAKRERRYGQTPEQLQAKPNA